MRTEKFNLCKSTKKLLTLITLLTLGVGQMWADGASWIGNSYIVIGSTWYNASGTGQSAGAFNGKDLGKISSLSLGGEVQTYGQSDGAGNPARMHYQFDNGSSTYITLPWDKYANNNNYFKSTGNSISLSGLAAGSHKLKVWFEQPDGNQWDSNGGNNYVADFTLNPLVTFKANGGTGSDYTQRVTYNTNTTLTSNTFTKTGYDFAGWATSADGNVVYANGATVKLTAHTNLFAKWTPKTTTVTLSANAPGGETVTGGGTTVTATYDAALPSFSALTCTGGYALTGYWTKATGDATKVINANGTFNANSGIWNRTDGATLTLYARWSLDRTLTYDGNTSTGGSVPASPTVYSNGASVTVLGNTNSLVKTGYTFTGWNTAANGSGASYSAGSTITMNGNYTLYAQWSENKTTVNLVASPAGGGTFTVGGAAATSTTAGVTTTRSVAAVPYPGYRTSATVWSKNNNYITLSSTTTNPTTVRGDGSNGNTTTLTGNFTQTYAYLQGRMTIYTAVARSTKKHIASSEGGWDESSNRMKMDYDGTNHRFYLHTYMTPKELSTAQSGNEQYFHFKTSTSSSSDDTNPQVYNPSTGRTLTASGTGNKKATEASDAANNIWFDNNSTTNGYAIIYFDEAGVWYELEHSLIYDKNSGSGTAPATTCHLNGTNATAESGSSISKSQYTFSGWNTNQYITGTNYAAGASVPMSANTTLYAKWTRSVTLNANGGGSGSTSVTATYNCATLPTITAPSKTGYTFGGWNTANDGSGDIVINTSGEFLPITGWCDSGKRFTRTASDATLYAKWTQTVVLNANTSYHGSGSNTSATIVLNATAKSSITHCTPATGYHLEGYYTAASGGTKILTADGTFASSNITVDAVAYISSGKWVKAGATTLYAHYEANTYNVTLTPGEGGSGSNGTMTVDYDATAYKTFSHSITQTGYHIKGWYDNSASLKVLDADGTFAGSSVTGYISSSKWCKASDCTLQAWWDPDNYTVTLDVDEDHQGTISGATTSHTVTYNTVTTDIPNLPTAANGYGLDGYYTGQNGAGTKIINGDGTFIASVDGYTDADAKWIKVGGETLYAYYKQAEITGITITGGNIVSPSTPTSVAVVISPTPVAPTTVCWRVLYSNDNPLDPQPTFSPANAQGTSVSFTSPEASGTYKLEAVLHIGAGCGGTELSTYTETFQVAGAHTVTVQYKDASGNTIKESGSVTGRPLTWSDDITAPEIFGYTFDHWNAGDGITIKNGDSDPVTTSTDETIKIKAVYDGRLTAVYNQKKYIYLDLSEQFGASEWTAPHVYFYKAAGYWDDTYGAGATGVNCVGKGAMTNIDGTDIWYYDYGSVSNFGNVIAFTKVDEKTQEHFYNTEAIYRADFSEGTPMFVPLNGQVKVTKNTNCDYYSAGYWVTYLGEKTGYNLRIKNNSTDALIKSIPFTSDTKRMTMKAVTDLEASTTYKFEIERETGKYYKNSSSRTYSNRNSNWKYTEAMSIGTIVTTATGNYTFTLGYADYNNDQDYEMRVNVEYPVTSGDYRLVYKDDVHSAYKPSATIVKTPLGKDTVSFFVRRDQNPKLYKQTASVNESTGAVTWTTNTSTNLITSAMMTSPITQDSVYNFNLVMDESGNLSIGDVKAYTGNFYIRTDAANNKWDNYTNADHLMTYSEYSEKNSTYSHYFMAFVGNGSNVKFVVANDYSPCISDTLVQQGGDTYHVDASGFIGADANVRFMWKKHDNSTGRAYLAAAKNDGSKFLVLRANSSTDLMDTGGNALINSANAGQAGYNHKAPDNSIQFVDNENWIYETNVKIKPGAFVKLYAFFNTKNFYYKGKDNNTFDKDNAIQLMTGSGEAELVRVIYDFKTDRLLAAWQPSGNIDEVREINADVMFVREHQEDITQLTFSKGDGGTMGAIKKIETAYGVLRFNKWTINNKSKTGTHSPLSPLLSRYERDLFYVSFPFRVSMNEVFGFGTYGQHWIIEYYDGATRASKGYWAESGPNWKYVTDRRGKFFEPNQGYIIALDLDELGESSSVWDNGVENVELYFPSYGKMGDITNASVTYEIPEHECTINRSNESNGHGGTLGPQYDRRVKDSHWNVISVPTYVNTDDLTFTNTDWITTADDTHVGPNFLYEWNPADNSVTARAGDGYTYHAMHAYLVQYCGDITWSTSVTPTAAPRRNPDYRGEYNFRLELTQNDVAVDQTYVKLSDNEAVTTGFEFNYDLSKEFNKNRANIYTLIGTEQVAGNVLPLTDQTTVVPVGVQIATAGDYTFSLPDGTEGIGVTLIDNQTGIRTRLSALDYTVNLAAGTHDGRFILEISPIHNATTEVELINGANGANDEIGARKVLIDGILYIVKGDKLYDVRGTMIK